MKGASLPTQKQAAKKHGPDKRVKRKPINAKAARERRAVGAGLPRYAPEETPLSPSSLTVLPVDPNRIFAHWELHASPANKPVLRVIEAAKKGAHPKHHDIAVRHRGSAYIKVSPGRRYVLMAGHFDANGKFIAAAKAGRVSAPRSSPPKGKSVLPEKYFEVGLPEGSREK